MKRATSNTTASGLLDDQQAAEHLKVEPRTLRQYRKVRGLPHIKISAKVIRYRMADLDQWLTRLAS